MFSEHWLQPSPAQVAEALGRRGAASSPEENYQKLETKPMMGVSSANRAFRTFSNHWLQPSPLAPQLGRPGKLASALSDAARIYEAELLAICSTSANTDPVGATVGSAQKLRHFYMHEADVQHGSSCGRAVEKIIREDASELHEGARELSEHSVRLAPVGRGFGSRWGRAELDILSSWSGYREERLHIVKNVLRLMGYEGLASQIEQIGPLGYMDLEWWQSDDFTGNRWDDGVPVDYDDGEASDSALDDSDQEEVSDVESDVSA